MTTMDDVDAFAEAVRNDPHPCHPYNPHVAAVKNMAFGLTEAMEHGWVVGSRECEEQVVRIERKFFTRLWAAFCGLPKYRSMVMVGTVRLVVACPENLYDEPTVLAAVEGLRPMGVVVIIDRVDPV